MERLIVALDVDSFEKAKKLVDKLYPTVKIFKIGIYLFTCCGRKIIDYIYKKGAKVFLDLKFHDIPSVVAKASKEAAKMGVFMFDMHAQGGLDMMRQAKKEAGRSKVIGVTILTSKEGKDEIRAVLKLAKLVKKAGLHGIVCSGREAKAVRKKLGKNFIIVAPGIRPKWAATDDQKRIMTPGEAIKAGADYIVVGRPIIKAKEPKEAAKRILDEIS